MKVFRHADFQVETPSRYGEWENVGTEADLKLLKSCIERHSSGPRRVDTVMIRGADHMYAGEEAQVAETIAKWADTLLTLEAGKGEAQTKPWVSREVLYS